MRPRLQRIRQLLVFDRLLDRFQDALGRRVLLKGGVVLETRLARARAAKDLDVSLAGDVATAWTELIAAAGRDAGDRLTFELRPKRGAPTVDDPSATRSGSTPSADTFRGAYRAVIAV